VWDTSAIHSRQNRRRGHGLRRERARGQILRVFAGDARGDFVHRVVAIFVRWTTCRAASRFTLADSGDGAGADWFSTGTRRTWTRSRWLSSPSAGFFFALDLAFYNTSILLTSARMQRFSEINAIFVGLLTGWSFGGLRAEYCWGWLWR